VVNACNSPEEIGSVADFLDDIRQNGVRLWSEQGQLRYKAPKGALTKSTIERLAAHVDEIVAILESASSAEASDLPALSRGRNERVPLSFSQLAHWNLYRLAERPSFNVVSSITRWAGTLDIRAFRDSLSEMIHRHEALRTRIVVCSQIPTQEIAQSGSCDLKIDDLRDLPDYVRDTEARNLIERYTFKPIRVLTEPLFRATLLRVRDDEHLVLLEMEHIISDGFSMGILLRDLFAAYLQTVKGRACSLPPIPIQFSDYAVWQRATHNSRLQKHGAYWDQHLKGCPRVRFPEEPDSTMSKERGWGLVPVRVDAELTLELRSWCRLRRTTLVMGVFVAYVAAVLRWCNVTECVFLYQTDGRTHPNLQNTIGYFASPLYLPIAIHQNDTFVDLLRRITDEYCRAYGHADFSYMEAQLPRPEFTRNTCFNWVPQGFTAASPDAEEPEQKVTCSRIYFEQSKVENLERDTEPTIGLTEMGDEIRGCVQFPLDQFRVDTMEKFTRHFARFVKALVKCPDHLVSQTGLASESTPA
jgi:hypothetical protein